MTSLLRIVAAACAIGSSGMCLLAQAVCVSGFAEPVMVNCDGKPLGATRYYPSPVFHDLDGDGRQDIVIGDLTGAITCALQTQAEPRGDGQASSPGPSIAFEGEHLLRDARGRVLDFHNW